MKLKTLSLAGIVSLSLANANAQEQFFKRSASFLSCTHFAADCDTDKRTSAEILYADKAGKRLVYSDSPAQGLGIVDITNLDKPVAKKHIQLNGEPTSITIKGNFALVAVNLSKDYVDVAGELQVYDLTSFEQVASLDLGGQPDSIAISPDNNYAVVAIENERNEDKDDGAMPQLPAGYAVIIDTKDADPKKWQQRKINLEGIATVAGDDPEPEYVDINSDNIAVMTLQENNHIVLIDLASGDVIKHFSAGSVDLENIDLTEGKPKLISMTESKKGVAREPDGVSWIDNEYFVTANEGDWVGGSRGFTVFNKSGEVIWDSGNTMDHHAVRMGHYPDKRSGNKGSEPENVEVGTFNGERLLFVNAERASLVFVYNVDEPKTPVLKQILPAGVGPEGAFALPSRNVLFVASEVDKRKDKIRSAVNIYTLGAEKPTYPTLISKDSNSLPVAWSALSGLAADTGKKGILYAVEDSFYKKNRIFKIDANKAPAEIIDTMTLKDSKGLLSSVAVADKVSLTNDDKTVNLDLEGIDVASEGGFWVVSEGKGTQGDAKKPFQYPNLLLKVTNDGSIDNVITLPDEITEKQLRFGLEGVTEDDGKVYVIFQRGWNKEKDSRIGIYNIKDKSWNFVFYPLDKPTSPKGGWVGLSDITSLGNGKFYILERDNQGGPDARVKKVYEIDLSKNEANSVVSKKLVRDLIYDLKKPNGLVPEKVEGLAVTPSGDMYIVNDNDGLDDSSGETQLLKLN